MIYLRHVLLRNKHIVISKVCRHDTYCVNTHKDSEMAILRVFAPILSTQTILKLSMINMPFSYTQHKIQKQTSRQIKISNS